MKKHEQIKEHLINYIRYNFISYRKITILDKNIFKIQTSIQDQLNGQLLMNLHDKLLKEPKN